MSEFEIIETVVGKAKLKRTTRKTLAISVLPDGTLELIAPLNSREDMVLAKVAKRRAWIMKQRRQFQAMNATRPALRYISGATHRYLGKQYRLKVETSEATSVSLRGGFLHVRVRERSDESVNEALQTWYRDHAKQQFTQRLAVWDDWCARRRLPKPTLRLRTMAKRWGSALKDGTICLNPELIKAPSACVDYVIAHEVCHLKHPNHGTEFWRLLDQVRPGWRHLKERLERSEAV